VATDRRELHGVGDEVPRDLLESFGIAGRHQPLGGEGDLEPLSLLLRLAAHHVRRGLDDPVEVVLREVQLELPAHDPGDVEEVVDQPRLDERVPLDAVERLLHAFGRDVAGLEHAGPAHHGVQRRAQFMGDQGEELVLHPAGRFGRQARLALAGERRGLRVAAQVEDRHERQLSRGVVQRDQPRTTRQLRRPAAREQRQGSGLGVCVRWRSGRHHQPVARDALAHTVEDLGRVGQPRAEARRQGDEVGVGHGGLERHRADGHGNAQPGVYPLRAATGTLHPRTPARPARRA